MVNYFDLAVRQQERKVSTPVRSFKWFRRKFLGQASAMNQSLAESVEREVLDIFQSTEPGYEWHEGDIPIVHCIGTLGAGGAERQLVTLLSNIAQRGLQKQGLLVVNPLKGPTAHFLPQALESAAMFRVMGDADEQEVMRLIAARPEVVRLIFELEEDLRSWVLSLMVEFALMRPALVHCWLDHCNIWGGVAAMLAGVPTVLLSTRNVNPEHFPYLFQPYMLPWYRRLMSTKRVGMLNNSHAGAADYANWIGNKVDEIPVVLNGVDFSALARPGAVEINKWRAGLGLAPNEQLVLGVFRLSEEKRPLLFADIAIELVLAHPNCRVLHIGDGPLRDAIERRVSKAGLAEKIRFLGQRPDVNVAFSASNVVLHVSQYEGTPNVVLEAQNFGVPVVATKAGGTTDAVLDGVTGYLLECDDREGIVKKMTKLLSDPDKAQKLGEAGVQFVHERFGLDRMVSETLDIQRAAFQRVGLPDLTR